MGVYKNGYTVMLEPYAGSFEAYIVLLKEFILENTPWILDEESSTETELYFDTGYEIIYFYPYSGNVDRMNLKITTKYGEVVTGSTYMSIVTTINDMTYNSCTLYALIKEGLSIWYIHETTTSSLLYTKYTPNNLSYEYVTASCSRGLGACQVEFQDIINNRISQARAALYSTSTHSMFGNQSTIGSYQLEDGTWDKCYIMLKAYNGYNMSYDSYTSVLADKIYQTKLFIYEYSGSKKIIGFIPQLCYMIRPTKSIPRIYYPFKNNGFTYQYISYPICYIEKDGE